MLKSSKPLTDAVIMAYRLKLSHQLRHVLFTRRLLRVILAVCTSVLLVCLIWLFCEGLAPAALKWSSRVFAGVSVLDLVLYQRMWTLRETIQEHLRANERQVDEKCENNAIARYIRDGVLASGRSVYRCDVDAMNAITGKVLSASGGYPLHAVGEVSCSKKP